MLHMMRMRPERLRNLFQITERLLEKGECVLLTAMTGSFASLQVNVYSEEKHYIPFVVLFVGLHSKACEMATYCSAH